MSWREVDSLPDRLAPDVAPEMRAFKLNPLHGGVSGGLRGSEISAQRRHPKHTPAVRDDSVAGARGAGVKNLGVRQGVGFGEAGDWSALGIAARIAAGRHYD